MDEKESWSLFENFSSQFSEKRFKGGFLNEKRNYQAPRMMRFAFVTRFPIWPSVGSAAQLINKGQN